MIFFEIHKETGKSIERVRKGKRPTLMEVKSTCWHGFFVGDAQKYHSEKDIAAAMKKDRILNFGKNSLRRKYFESKTSRKLRGIFMMRLRRHLSLHVRVYSLMNLSLCMNCMYDFF